MYAAAKAAQQDYRHLFVLMDQKRGKIYANDPQQGNQARNINEVITVTLVLKMLSDNTRAVFLFLQGESESGDKEAQSWKGNGSERQRIIKTE